MTPDAPTVAEATLKLALAVLLGLPLGWMQERASRSAGLRTYPLLSACVCGFLLLALRTAGGPSEQADIFFGVLTGIGFIGSGALMRSPEGTAGMATAVSLWLTGAIGAGVAYGAPLLAAALSLISALALRGLSHAPARRAAP